MKAPSIWAKISKSTIFRTLEIKEKKKKGLQGSEEHLFKYKTIELMWESLALVSWSQKMNL